LEFGTLNPQDGTPAQSSSVDQSIGAITRRLLSALPRERVRSMPPSGHAAGKDDAAQQAETATGSPRRQWPTAFRDGEAEALGGLEGFAPRRSRST
jgi:hypothetical protein